MQHDSTHRHSRTPADEEEIARRMARRDKLKQLRILAFKKSKGFRLLNVFSLISCFFMWELVFCFFGPCYYREVVPEQLYMKFGSGVDERGYPFLKEIQLNWFEGEYDVVRVDTHVPFSVSDPPDIRVGRDYLLYKALKVKLGNIELPFRLERASPQIFLSLFLILITLIGYVFNLNLQPVPLTGLCIMNILGFLSILLI